MKKLFIIAIVGALAGGVVQVAASSMKSAEYRGVGMDKGSKPSTMSSNKTTTTTTPTTTRSGSLKSGSITATTSDSTTVTVTTTAPTMPSEPSTGVGWMTAEETDEFFGPEEAQRAPGSTDPIDQGGVPQGEPEAERAGQ